MIAAPISVPGNMRPVSSMVTWAWMGTTRPWRDHGPMARRDGGLARQQVVDGLDHQQVDAALEQRVGEFFVGSRTGRRR